MKQFICWVPYTEPSRLGKVAYQAVDNERLKMEETTAFPIMHVINGYVKENEEIELLVGVPDYEWAKANFEALKAELKEIEERKHIKCHVKEIEVPYDDSVASQVEAFKKFKEEIQKNAEVFACLTYGSKPSPIVEMMILRYAKIVRGCINECTVYGKLDFQSKQAYIYDITALTAIDDIMRILSEDNVSNADDMLNSVLNMWGV